MGQASVPPLPSLSIPPFLPHSPDLSLGQTLSHCPQPAPE